MSAILVAWQDTKRALRDPGGLLLTLFAPLALTVAIGLVSGHRPFEPAPASGFDALSYIAPGMALFFLMLGVRNAARAAAEDNDRGVRDRLRVAPVSRAGITVGTTASHVALLFLQLVVLVGISSIVYGLAWGPAGQVLLLCLFLALAAGGWAALLLSLGRTPARINALGMIVTLTFGIVSRSFAAVIPPTPLLDAAAKVTPNWWGTHAFLSLAMGVGLPLRDVAALSIMVVALFAAAALLSRPRAGGKR